MRKTSKSKILMGFVFIIGFAVFTVLVQKVDVKPLGVNGTNIGFSTLNCMFHKLFGVNMPLYIITDWAGLVPIFAAFGFAVLGLVQLLIRRNLFKVDADILVLGIYYIVVAALYVVFEMVPINFRPILINGFMETSYPSSTTLLVLGVMPTFAEQICRRSKTVIIKRIANILTAAFSAFMVIGRLLSGVHWLSDILGSIIISVGLFYIYKGFVLMLQEKGMIGG